MIHAALEFVRTLDREALCVVIGLGCWAAVPFAWANDKANGLIDAIRSLKQ